MRGHRLRLHQGLRAGDPLPPLALVEPLIERQEAAGGHWYWLGDFTADREPTLPWRTPDERLVHFTALRLLLQLWGDFPPGSGLLNRCGLVSCVNPSHWTVETPQERGRKATPVVLVDFHGHGWTNATRAETCNVCFQPPGKPCDPVYHDADYRRRTASEATTCLVCNAPPYEECDAKTHKLVFQYQLQLQKNEAKEP